MNKDVVKSLRERIFEHIVTNKEGYKGFSSEQKIKFTADAFENANALCCELWNTNPNLNSFWYMYGESSNAIAETIGKSSFIAFSAKVAIELKKPETVYRLLFHEMRHLYQQQELLDKDGEGASYYWEGHKTHAAWAASPSEKAADRFAFAELLKTMGGGALKSDDRATAAKSFLRLSWLSAKNYAEHLCGSVRHSLDKKHDFFKKTSKPLGVGLDEEFGGKTGFVGVQRLFDIMARNPEIFGAESEYTQEMHDVIAENSEGGIQELVDVVLQANQIKAPRIINSKLIEEGVLKEYNGGYDNAGENEQVYSTQDVNIEEESLYELHAVSEDGQLGFEQ